MSTVRSDVVAILCSDIHLSLRAPAARAGEPDWLAAQERVMKQLALLRAKYEAPILCAGDLFDKWNPPVELANWAVRNCPPMFVLPGQHDLPYHSTDLIHRSALWNLCTHRRKFRLLNGELGEGPTHINVQGFPWGTELDPPSIENEKLNVALVHHYVWIPGSSYPGAPKSSKVHNLFGDGMGWDVIVCGDNHKGFLTKTKSGTVIFNCGTLQRRKTDEVDYHPQVGLLKSDGSVEPHFLDTSEDIIATSVSVREDKEEIQLEDFLTELQGLEGDSLDFQTAVHHTMDDREVSPDVRRILLEAME